MGVTARITGKGFASLTTHVKDLQENLSDHVEGVGQIFLQKWMPDLNTVLNAHTQVIRRVVVRMGAVSLILGVDYAESTMGECDPKAAQAVLAEGVALRCLETEEFDTARMVVGPDALSLTAKI